MQSSTLVETNDSLAGAPLTAADRCDAGCGAQARVRVHLSGYGVLMFCSHHYNKHESSLSQREITVDDFTHEIP